MKEEEFRKAMKRRGKKPHVVAGLINSVKLFEDYLGRDIEDASVKDLTDYAAVCEQEKKDSARIKIRGVALYYTFTGNTEMASAAAAIREKGIAKHRSTFLLKDFLWVNLDHVARLKKLGISNVDQMLEDGRSPQARKTLSDKTGIPLDGILELVKLSNLAQQFAIKGVRARLYYEAGVDTWDKMEKWDPEEFRKMLVKFVEETGFPGIPPTPMEARHTIEAAAKMPRIVEW